MSVGINIFDFNRDKLAFGISIDPLTLCNALMPLSTNERFIILQKTYGIVQRLSYIDLMDFGKGLDFLKLDVRGTAVEYDAIESPLGSSGSNTFYLYVVENKESFDRSFGFSSSVKGKYSLFSASARVNFAESFNFTSYKKYLIVKVVAENATQILKKPRLSHSAFNLIDQDKDGFREQFGDYFVAGMTGGGVYLCVIEATTESEDKSREVSACFKAAYGGFVAGGSVDLLHN